MTLGAKSSRLTCYNSKLPVPAASSRTAVLTNEKWLKHHAVQQYEAAERLPLFILPNGLQVRYATFHLLVDMLAWLCCDSKAQ